MIRNLKTLCLALAALSALSLVGASAAHALVADVAGGLTTTGIQVETGGHSDHSLTLSSSRVFTCFNVAYDGTIEDGAPEIIATPTYSGCFSNETQPTTVTHNGCNYRVYSGEEVGADHFNKVTTDIQCPEGKQVEVHVYSSHANHTTGTVLCTYKVHPFTGKHNITLENTTSGIDDIDVITTVEGIVVTRVAGSALFCGPENQTGTYTGASTVRAYSDTAHNNQVNIAITKG